MNTAPSQHLLVPFDLLHKRVLLILFILLLKPATSLASEILDSAAAEYREVHVERLIEGVIEAVNQGTVSSQTSGRVTEINYDINDYVPKNAALLKVRDTQQRASYDAAKASHDEAISEYHRITELFEKKLVSKADIEKAEARNKAASATMEQAVDQLENTIVRAPYSGIVTARHINIGETVQPGQALFTGLSLEQLRAVAYVPQDIINVVRETQHARIITSDKITPALEATKIIISPYAEAGSHTFMVRVMLPQADHGLFPGMAVKVAFTTRKDTQLAIPAAAVVHRSEVSAAYVIEDKQQLKLRQLRTGHLLEDNFIAIHAGLEEGERVALNPILAGAQLKLQQAHQRQTNQQ